MRVLIVGNFQGPQMIQQRNIRRNLSMAGSGKMRSICCALNARGHQVAIASVGRAAERTGRWYPPMQEELRFNDGSRTAVWYMGSFDVPGLGNVASWLELLRQLPRIRRFFPYDVIIVYNCDLHSVVASVFCRGRYGIPTVLEYEDSALMARDGNPTVFRKMRRVNELLIQWSAIGVFGPSPELIEAVRAPNRLLLEGALSEELAEAAAGRASLTPVGQPLTVVYSGGLAADKGVLGMLDALDQVDQPIHVHVSGSGNQSAAVAERCQRARHPTTFHGLLSHQDLVSLQTRADICINPHRVSWHKGLSWPFKVAEYMAACGVVISSRTGRMDPGVQQRLHLYDCDDPGVIANTLNTVIANWDCERELATERRKWAIDRWGPEGVGRQLEGLLVRGLQEWN